MFGVAEGPEAPYMAPFVGKSVLGECEFPGHEAAIEDQSQVYKAENGEQSWSH